MGRQGAHKGEVAAAAPRRTTRDTWRRAACGDRVHCTQAQARRSLAVAESQSHSARPPACLPAASPPLAPAASPFHSCAPRDPNRSSNRSLAARRSALRRFGASDLSCRSQLQQRSQTHSAPLSDSLATGPMSSMRTTQAIDFVFTLALVLVLTRPSNVRVLT